MRCTAALTLATGLISLTEAIQLAKRTNSAPRVVGAEIQRREVTDPVTRDQARRRKKRDSVQATLDNEETLYFANASLGTPAQSLRLHLDTGSSDLWVNTDSSDLCSSKTSSCSTAGTYNANDSSTYEYVNSLFNISYVDGSGATGDYVKDVFNFGGQNLTDMQFGVGYDSSSTEGVLGIGYTTNEVAVNRAGLEAYSNLPQLMVDKGIIQSNAYSLWLNDLDASRGSILFGGVDTEKYHGTLATLPIIQEYGDYREFIIALTGLGANGKNGSYFSSNDSSSNVVPVLLDSGSSLTYLPDSVVSSIYDDFLHPRNPRGLAALPHDRHRCLAVPRFACTDLQPTPPLFSTPCLARFTSQPLVFLSEMSAPQVDAPTDGSWDEARCVDALATLEKLQDQVDELRHSVTNLTAPFLATQSSPEALGRDFKQTAITEAKRLQTFERTWKSRDVQEILAHATLSLKDNPDLSKGAGVARYGWVDVAEKQQKPAKSKEKKLRGKGSDADDRIDAASIPSIVNAFKEAHPNFKVDLENGRIITITFRVPSMVLTFKITCNIDSENKATFLVECPENMPLFSAITRCIASRPKPNDISYLLDMIAAYTNTRTAKCTKCGKLLDNAALSPAARRSKKAATGDGNKQIIWEPIHEGCL